jgi:hypothetical protein
LKPALYAGAGIPHYWVVTTDGRLVVHAHTLDEGSTVYRPAGVFETVIETVEPWPISLPLARLTPRFL